MAEVLISKNGVISLGSVHGEEDLKMRPGISINPPPEDGRCQCCGKHISQLKPFGKAGDPLVGDFDGAYLVKIWRPDGPYNEEAEQAMKEAAEAVGDKDPLDWFIIKYGKEKGERLYFTAIIYSSVGKSWECRDCIILDTNEYFEKLTLAEENEKTENE